MFNKPSWNNKREGFLRPPDKEQEERRQKLLHQMSETLSKKKEEFEERIEKIPLAELAQQQHFNLDASIEEEANKRPQLAKPKPKEKFNPVIIPVFPVETEVTAKETKEAAEGTLWKKEVFYHPDAANTDLTDLINALQVVAHYLNDAKQEVISLGENIHATDFETSDFLHSIELSKFSSTDKEIVFDKMVEIRKRRRSYKERLAYIKELEQFVDKNPGIATKLGTLKHQLENVQDRQKTAMYFTKVRNDIKEDDLVHIGNKVIRHTV